MERQLKYFFDFLENDKKLSENTLQSYKRDLKQFKRYIEACEVNYNHVKEEDIKETINKLTDEMLEYASKMEFEKAAEIRDKIKELEKLI